MTTKKQNKKAVQAVKKVTVKKEIKKAEVKQAKPSISKMVFAYVGKNQVLKSDNRKAFFPKLKEEILKVFPDSKFNENHYYWYLNKYKMQEKLGLGLDCLKQIKKETKAEIAAKGKALENKKKAEKLNKMRKAKKNK